MCWARRKEPRSSFPSPPSVRAVPLRGVLSSCFFWSSLNWKEMLCEPSWHRGGQGRQCQHPSAPCTPGSSRPPDTPRLLQEARTGIAGWHLYIKMMKRRDLAGELPPQHGHRGVAPGPAGMHGEAGGCAVRSGMSPWWHRRCGRAVLLFVENQSSPRSGAAAPNHHHCQAGSCSGAATHLLTAQLRTERSGSLWSSWGSAPERSR